MRALRAVTLLAAVALGACRAPVVSAPQALRCAPPLEPNLRTDLYTGGGVSDSSWRRFTEEVLSKHFQGGTVNSNNGWWTGPRGILAHGDGRTITILAPARDSTSQRERTRAVIQEFKARFRHLSVGWEEDWVCVGW